MASNDNEKIKKVEKVIDDFTSSNLGITEINILKDIASKKIKNKATAIEVADSVFDYANDNFCGNITMSVMCKQILPKTVLTVLRNEIIKELK